jgi:putative methyltransferase
MKLYFEAEPFLAPAPASLQSRIFSAKLTLSPKHVYAVVHSTLRYHPYILAIIRRTRLKEAIKTRCSEALLALLVHDLLFLPRGRIQLDKHPLKEQLLRHQTRLRAELVKLKLKHKVRLVEELPAGEVDESPVRWFRVNPLAAAPAVQPLALKVGLEPRSLARISLEAPAAPAADAAVDAAGDAAGDAAAAATAAAFAHAPLSHLRPVALLAELTAPGAIYHDPYIPHLYGVHPREKITLLPAYLSGHIIIQDRASCFPAHILNADPRDVHREVIDACAAPGNKTTHATLGAAAPGAPGPVVYAFERDANRVKTLRTMCLRAILHHPTLIQVTHADFTSTHPHDFPRVTGMVVDPSCSGLGIFGRAHDKAKDDAEESAHIVDAARLAKLAGFQAKIVKHALSFPAVRKVVYLTCLVHAEENERVVVDVLADVELRAAGWTLADRLVVLPEWPRRGWAEEFSLLAQTPADAQRLAGGCVRAEPKVDGGIGFFAACFVRATPEAEAEAEVPAEAPAAAEAEVPVEAEVPAEAPAAAPAAKSSAPEEDTALECEAESEWAGFD